VTEFIQVITTVDSEEAANSLASAAVSARLAACAQVSGPITSAYWWRGELDTANEWMCTLKTRRACYPELEALLLDIHPYETPEILAVPILAGNPAYLAWIEQETTRPSP